ncbi:glycine zipper family protein [Methylomicrobium sp. Wu6]|uniref:glycine zipper family protein n=1 Tax=Methylomicrobium sp. Wu6 TaxID=3107928 RepID=UPI002DD6AF4D|nr:glycine zipper family protein [Methylomicrobium sp. Wu6]MEC4749152.1 glycine zipper family protein [Methylomicrobium sp. Wu6]
MKTHLKQIKSISTCLMAALSLSVFAQSPMVYPAQGQTQDQMSKDRYECHTWAVQQSGFDPSSGAAASQPSTQQGGVGKEALRGGFRGAAAGAAIGAIAGDAGKGAAIGATAGGLKRGFGQIDANRAGSSAASSDAANNYNRALGACLTGRGYSVQ